MGNKVYNETSLPFQIQKWIRNTLAEVSDEIGVEENGKYLLVYEGWSAFCVSKVFDSTKSDKENEDSYYQFAEEQSNAIIDEYIKKYKNHYCLIDCGHEPTGLYGITWALFKNLNNKPISKTGEKAPGYLDT